MKKLLAIFMVLLLMVSFAACGGEEVNAKMKSDVDYEFIAIMLEAAGTESDMTYWEVDVQGELFFITFANNGMSDVVKNYKAAGYDENYSGWLYAKETTMKVYQANIDLIKSLGVENPKCMVDLVNENNHNEVFLSIYNGVIIVDIMKSN